jgi:hypothetical protein
MISLDKTGGRTIHLFIPFDHGGKRIESITLGPLRLGHVLSWNEGAWKTMIELLVDMAGVDQTVIRELRYPDADRVMECFMTMLTPEIRDDISNGRIPQKMPEYREEPEPPRVTNGGGDLPSMPMMGPGVPLPEAGFDLSEEP